MNIYCKVTLVTGLFGAALINTILAKTSANTSVKTHASAGIHNYTKHSVQLGPRPFFLVQDMDEGTLKERLNKCSDGPFQKSDFSIGHRGAALQFPEHTRESYIAAAKMGAGILECDVTFTQDRQLVCRHSQSDLHTTTDILLTPLAAKCTKPFTPADPTNDIKASAECRTSDITLAEFKTLRGKMDAFNPNATTVDEYIDATAKFRTDLYATRGTLMTHAESIELFKQLGVKFTPELKAAAVDMPYQSDHLQRSQSSTQQNLQSYSQENYAQHMIDEYKAAGINPRDVWPQSFNLDDIKYWIKNEPAFAQQAVYLDDRVYKDDTFKASASNFEALYAEGIRIIAPPMFALVASESKKMVVSDYAKFAKNAGLNIITWTVERSGALNNGGGWYYQTTNDITNNDGDIFNLIDVLAQDVGVLGIFSDWPATTTYYANCMNIK